MVDIHPTAIQFGKNLARELEWLKFNHPDKVALTHLAERFFRFLEKNDEVVECQPPENVS